MDGDGVAAVDGRARHAVRLRLHGERLAGRGVRVLLLDARDDVVAVVLHHEDDRQLPQRGDVERLVERALLRGAVAEEREHDLALAADLRGVGGAGRVRDALRDDARGAEEAALDVGQVHRAAVALAEPGLAAVDLGHHRLRVGAEHERVAVAAVGREHLVVGLERRERADDRGLRPVGEVGVAADHAGVLLERPLHPLLELADPQHLRVHPDQPLVVEAVLRHWRSFPARRRAARCRSRRLVRRSARSAGCAAPPRAPRRPTGPRSRARGRRRRSRGSGTRPRRGARRWLTVSSTRSGMFS